jgi:DNA replication and repair protein RecF
MALEDSRERDIRYGSTTVGPHRDDLMFSLDGTDVRTFGSQGQQRTTVLSLKLAQMEVLREERGEAPVLLLDDVFSELDRKRQEMLMVSVEGCQTFLTCTHLEDLEQARIQESMQIYRVENGNITEA